MTGKFNSDTVFPKDDMRSTWDLRSEVAIERRQRIKAVHQFFAGGLRTPAQTALAWIWTRSERTVPIPGFKTLAQVQENIKAMDFGLMSKEQMQKIDEIFARAPVI